MWLMPECSVYGGSLRQPPALMPGRHRPTMSVDTGSERWFALQVRTRWESSTAVLLSGKGYQTLLPTFKTRKRWNGKVREVNAPLFPGYVFCQFDAQKRLPILVTPGVLQWLVVAEFRCLSTTLKFPPFRLLFHRGSVRNLGPTWKSARKFESRATL